MILTAIILLIILILILIMSYFCYKISCYNKTTRKIASINEPANLIKHNYKEEQVKTIEEVKKLPYQKLHIKSNDELNLYARYYEYEKNAPLEIIVHGYKGSGLKDMCYSVLRAFDSKHNALVVDQRGCGESDGNTMTFGIKERFDCVLWINKAIELFGQDIKIILTGLSMGAATVLMTSGMNLPKNVVGVIADCGYDSPVNIIKKVIKDKKAPLFLFYPCTLLGARIFGKFNFKEYSPLEAVKKTTLPILFIHGDQDGFVPYEMSVNMQKECNSKSELLTIENAAHAVCYYVDKDKYTDKVNSFFVNENL